MSNEWLSTKAEQERKEEERKAEFERQQKEYEAEQARREKQRKARNATFERIMEACPRIVQCRTDASLPALARPPGLQLP